MIHIKDHQIDSTLSNLHLRILRKKCIINAWITLLENMFSFEYFSDKLTFFTVNIYWQSGIELFWQDKFVMFDNLHGLIEANLQDLELATKEKVWLFILKFCILLINGATFQSKLLIHLHWQQIRGPLRSGPLVEWHA